LNEREKRKREKSLLGASARPREAPKAVERDSEHLNWKKRASGVVLTPFPAVSSVPRSASGLKVDATQLDGRPLSNFSEKYVVALATAMRRINNFMTLFKLEKNGKKLLASCRRKTRMTNLSKKGRMDFSWTKLKGLWRFCEMPVVF
jgi:hypothetical protein